MIDITHQINPERLDETKPERNERSWWDWLRGKKEVEESEEEKLRKKLDEELKEAARKRATDFEEEQRAEEKREVAETKKLKKRWRKKLVEKSKQLLEDSLLENNEPKNGYEIAQQMVAEKIVTLHSMLEDETLDLRRSEVKALKIHIDFMGLLSEKLDRPELEVPEEVEQLYQTIARSIEETTGERISKPKPVQETPPDISPEDIAYNDFAANIVQSIRRAIHGSGIPSTSQDSANESQRLNKVDMASSKQNAQQATNELLRVVQKVATSTEVIRRDISHTETSRRLAEIVEKAEILRPPLEAKPFQKPLKETSQETAKFQVDPNKKIKHLTELELVGLAKKVELSHGWTLADMYRHGEIGREGVIKVLESYAKGFDYRREFSIRQNSWKHSKEQFPERLPLHDETSFSQTNITGRTSQTIKPDDTKKSSPTPRSSPANALKKLRDIGRELSTPNTPQKTSRKELRGEMKKLQEIYLRRSKNLFATSIIIAGLILIVLLWFIFNP